MYVGVLTSIAGFAIVFASWSVAIYGLIVLVAFNVAVRAIEEPRLRATMGQSYVEYCRRVPRWL